MMRDAEEWSSGGAHQKNELLSVGTNLNFFSGFEQIFVHTRPKSGLFEKEPPIFQFSSKCHSKGRALLNFLLCLFNCRRGGG